MEYTKERPLRVFTAFSGYDSQCMALDRIGIEYDLVGWSEIDKYAIQAHNAIYPQWAERNYGDISKIDWSQVPDFDLFTYSFPCTDLSLAGQQKGMVKGSGTRSSLLWECEKAIEVKRPKYLLMENVAALVSDKFRPSFHKWNVILEGYGYMGIYSKVLNAKDYNVPQNRKRIFSLAVHETADLKNYYFPTPVPLEKRLIDVLEKNVDEKYYVDCNVEKALGIIGTDNPSDTILGSLQEHASIQSIRGGAFSSSRDNGQRTSKVIVEQ